MCRQEAPVTHLKLQTMTKRLIYQIVSAQLKKRLHGGEAYDVTEAHLEHSGSSVREYMRKVWETCIHVSGLPNSVEDDELLAHLDGVLGSVVGVSVRTRDEINTSWALVSFSTPEEAAAAVLAPAEAKVSMLLSPTSSS